VKLPPDQGVASLRNPPREPRARGAAIAGRADHFLHERRDLGGLARLLSDKRHFTDLNDAEHLHSKRQTPYGQSLGYKRPYQRGDFDFAMITYGSNV